MFGSEVNHSVPKFYWVELGCFVIVRQMYSMQRCSTVTIQTFHTLSMGINIALYYVFILCKLSFTCDTAV